MFTLMQMKNFKSWQDTGEVRLAPLTGFFGGNSSGKSSLLQMLLLLKQTIESSDRNLPLKTGNFQEGYVNLGTIHNIIHADSTDLLLRVGWSLGAALKLTAQADVKSLDFTTVIHADSATNQLYVEQFTYTGEHLEAGLRRAANSEKYTVHAAN